MLNRRDRASHSESSEESFKSEESYLTISLHAIYWTYSLVANLYSKSDNRKACPNHEDQLAGLNIWHMQTSLGQNFRI